MGLFCVVAGFVFLASGVVGADKNVTIQLKNGRSLLVGEDNLDQLPGMLIHDLRLENPPEIAIQLIRRFPDLHLSQRLGTFLNLIGLDENGRKVNRIQEVVQDYYSLSPRLLLNLVGTEELKSFEDLADLGEEIGQETLEQIPLPAQQAWLEYLKGEESFLSVDALTSDPPTLEMRNGLTCSILSDLSPEDAADLLDTYNIHGLTKGMSYRLLKCFRKKMVDFWRNSSEDESSDDASGANILDLLDANSIPEVGGRVLALFPLEDLKAMKDRDLFLDIMSEIGKIPMSEMVYLISKDKFVELGNALAKEFDQDFRLDHLIMAGSLMYGMEDLVFESPEDFKTLVVEHMNGTDMKTVCLPSGRAMAFWGRVIEDAFSEPSSWTAETLTTLGDLLITLTSGMWNKVSPLELGLARATLLEESLYQKELWMQPPPYTNKTVLFEICSEWLGESQNRAYRSMMRKVLQVAQMEVDMKELQEANRAERTSAGDDGLRNKRSSELQRPMLLSLIDNRSFKRVFRRKKRQSSDQLELKTIREYIGLVQNQIKLKSDESSLTQLEIQHLNTYARKASGDISSFMKEKFDLSYLPTNYSEVFREFRVNGLVDNSVLAEVLAQITGAQLTYSQKVVRLLDITPEQLDKPREEFCLFFPQSRSCVLSTGGTTTVPPQTGEPASVPVALPTEFTCKGVIAAKEAAAIALDEDDLEDWDADELRMCLPVLGKMRWDLEKKRSIWKLLTQNFVIDDQTISGNDRMSLGNLLEAVWYEHPSRLNLSALNTETLSILGSFTYPSEELEDIAKKIVEDSSVGTPVLKPARRLSISERNRMPLAKAQIFGSMNHLVCGFSSSVVEDILNDDDVAKTLLPIYGRMEVCPSKEALGKIAEAAVRIYGEDVGKWSPSLVLSLGIIVSGLTKDQFKSLSHPSFESISPAAMRHLQPEHFEHVKLIQLRSLPDETVAQFDELHLKYVPEQFKNSLMEDDTEDLSGAQSKFSSYEGSWKGEEEFKIEESEAEAEPETDAMMVYAGLGIAGALLILFLVVILLCYVCKK